MENNHKPTPTLSRVASLLRAGPRAVSLRWYDQVTRRSTGTPVWELSQITPQLLCGGQHYLKGYQKMLDFGITAIVNMRNKHSDVEMGIGGERHLQLATVDNTPPTVADLMRGAEFVQAEIERGGKVYIHCAVGCGRAPTMTAAYLISTGLSPKKALKRIKNVRPFINLTKKQKRVLDEFASALKERREQS